MKGRSMLANVLDVDEEMIMAAVEGESAGAIFSTSRLPSQVSRTASFWTHFGAGAGPNGCCVSWVVSTPGTCAHSL